MQPPEIYTLQSLAAALVPSTQLVHAITQVGNSPKPTLHAERDGLSTFKLGLAVAEAWNIMNYQGIIVGSGRRHTGTSYAYQSLHTAWWIDPDDIHFSSSGRADSVDLMKIGVPIDNIHAVRYIVTLEGKPDDRPLL